MIRHFYIDNFKSLVDFHLPPEPADIAKFTCLIGPNGAGKSTVLQAFDFVKQLMHGRMDSWLDVRGWKKTDIVSYCTKKKVITFAIGFTFQGIGDVFWVGRFNPSLLRCTEEFVRLGGTKENLFTYSNGKAIYPRSKQNNKPLNVEGLKFQGSSLSALLLDHAHPAVQAVKYFFWNLKSLDMLAPNLIRKRSRNQSSEDIGYGGEQLSAFLHVLPKMARENLLSKLKRFYPSVDKLESLSSRSGLKDLMIVERFNELDLPINSRQLNDGMLRVLAILSQVEAKDDFKADSRSGPFYKLMIGFKELAKQDGDPVYNEYETLLFDEIENGIHPELIEKLVAYLLEAQQQIIVTTHSPMILNYLPDEVAKEAVIMLYRTPEGITRSVRYFDLPSARKKLDLLGPGEVFVDTDLATLTQEAEVLRNASS